MPLSRLLILFAVAVLGTSVLLGAGTAATYAYFSRDLPSPAGLAERPQFQSTRIYDRNGELLHEVYDPNQGRRTVVPLQQVPEHVRQAFLAAEDARFYQNPGIDIQGIARAFIDNLRSRGERLSGGSTITQQLVKLTLLSDERTWTRKIREAILALDLSRHYSKDQILELYLNTIYFGNQAYGLEAAAQTYFGKPASELSVPEAALLAGLIRSPSANNPFADAQAAKAAQQRVLEQMVRQGFLSEADAAAAADAPLSLASPGDPALHAPHFVHWVRQQLEANPRYGRAGLVERGLEVTTTLDLRLQSLAEQVVRDHVAQLGRYDASNGAVVVLHPQTGEVLALVGSADYGNQAIQGEVNVALAPRQPGSAIKPFTYLAAFHQGWSPATIIEDTPTTFPGLPGSPPYSPKNYDGQFHGKVTARTALANSYNIPAVKALEHVGVPRMLDLTRQLGITTWGDSARYGLALTLGGGEVRLLDLTAAYGALANGGQRVAPVSLLRVTDRTGQVLDQWPGPRLQPVFTPAHAYLVTSILSDNAARTPAFGASSPLRLSRPAAVKTGTTDDYRDNWTVGYTSQVVVGVWVGNADNRPMRGTTGLTGAAPIWHDLMEVVLAPLPVDPLNPPAGLERVTVSRESGRRWTEGCPEPKLEDWFVAGTAPTERCEAPTPTPTFTPAPTRTPAPETPTPVATPTAWPTSAAQATAEAQRQRFAETATAVAATRSQPATRPAQPTATGGASAPAAQPTNQPRQATIPTATATESAVRRGRRPR